jgi:uncharacterized protein (DUF4415 family)
VSKSRTTKKSTAKRKATGTLLKVGRSATAGKFLKEHTMPYPAAKPHGRMAVTGSSAKSLQHHPATDQKVSVVVKALKTKSTRKKASGAFDWSEFDKLDDKQIEQAVALDPDAVPIAGDEFWKNARVILPVPKQAISIRLDEDVLSFFKDSGPGYQSRMNAVLRSYMDVKK